MDQNERYRRVVVAMDELQVSETSNDRHLNMVDAQIKMLLEFRKRLMNSPPGVAHDRARNTLLMQKQMVLESIQRGDNQDDLAAGLVTFDALAQATTGAVKEKLQRAALERLVERMRDIIVKAFSPAAPRSAKRAKKAAPKRPKRRG